MSGSSKGSGNPGNSRDAYNKTVATNRRARRDYELGGTACLLRRQEVMS